MSTVETPYRIGRGRWLLVHADTDTVIEVHGDVMLVERTHESSSGTDPTVGVRFELCAEQVGGDGVWYSAWAPREALSEVIGALVAEIDS